MAVIGMKMAITAPETEPAIMPTSKAAYERQRKRGIQIFGATRYSEYNLLQAAAVRAMEPYK